ncbi:hypothetical protein ACFLT7_08205 [candidate division KSB1 bacterium]
MIQFHFLDWFWLFLFVALMVGCGVLFYRLGKRSESDFFLAGRGLPWWLPATSVYATHTATDTPIWIGGVIYRYGLAGLWYTFFCAWCAISAFVSTRIFRRSLAYTQAEWQSLRFSGLGSELLRGWLAGWQVFMNMFIMGWVGLAMGKVCAYVWGWPIWLGLVLFSSITVIYVLMAGYWGVVMADFQQGIIAFIVIVIASAFGIAAAGGPSGIMERLHELGQGWRANPFHFTGITTGDFPLVWFLTMIFIALLGGLGMGTSIDWYTEAQRIQSARSVRDASYSIWVGTIMTLLRNGVWAVAILAFYVLNPDITNQADYEMAWFRLSFETLPVGMIGFFFAAILAIHFSTISTALNLGALYATRDLYHHYINPQATDRQLVWVGRFSTVLLLLGSFIFGIMMMLNKDITQWLIFALWIMAAGIWLPNILQVVWWRFNSWAYLSSWIANLGFSWVLLANPRWIPEAPGSFAFMKMDEVEHTYSVYLAEPGVNPTLIFETDRWSHSLDVTPDGSSLVFYTESSERPYIMRYDLGTKTMEAVRVDSSLNTVGDISCDPTGDMISFTMYEPRPGLHNLFRLPLAGGIRSRITSFERNQFSVLSAELSPDGSRYLLLTSQRIGQYVSAEIYFSISLLPVAGGVEPQPLVEFPKAYTVSDLALRAPHNPTWSPDGGAIAFDFTEAGRPGREIYVIDL